jgi:hypothetical protein
MDPVTESFALVPSYATDMPWQQQRSMRFPAATFLRLADNTVPKRLNLETKTQRRRVGMIANSSIFGLCHLA